MAIRFYGKRGPYGWLSNFYACELTVGDLIYPSVEHLYQASKTLDPDEHEAIRLAPTPFEAYRLGQICKCRPDWKEIVGTPALAAKFMDDAGCVVETVQDHFMFSALILKFSIPDLRSKLLSTGTHELIESAPKDPYWGEGRGFGKNKLGRMQQLIRKGAGVSSDDAT